MHACSIVTTATPSTETAAAARARWRRDLHAQVGQSPPLIYAVAVETVEILANHVTTATPSTETAAAAHARSRQDLHAQVGQSHLLTHAIVTVEMVLEKANWKRPVTTATPSMATAAAAHAR